MGGGCEGVGGLVLGVPPIEHGPLVFVCRFLADTCQGPHWRILFYLHRLLLHLSCQWRASTIKLNRGGEGRKNTP